MHLLYSSICFIRTWINMLKHGKSGLWFVCILGSILNSGILAVISHGVAVLAAVHHSYMVEQLACERHAVIRMTQRKQPKAPLARLTQWQGVSLDFHGGEWPYRRSREVIGAHNDRIQLLILLSWWRVLILQDPRKGPWPALTVVNGLAINSSRGTHASMAVSEGAGMAGRLTPFTDLLTKSIMDAGTP
jgi:hypothetical protein